MGLDNLSISELKKNNLLPKKSFGQNFIFDESLLGRIVACAGNIKDKIVLEIGPGPGGLTREILSNNPKELIAIELDNDCLKILSKLKIHYPNFKLINKDALQINENELSNEKLTVIANLPYNVATALFIKWLNNINKFEQLTLMFQKEVAERICAIPGSKSYGRLSVISGLLAECYINFDIDPKFFFPPPKVTSSVITIIPRTKPLFDVDQTKLEKICKIMFGMRRKMIRVSLKQITDNVEEFLEGTGISPTKRAEELTIEQFCLLANKI